MLFDFQYIWLFKYNLYLIGFVSNAITIYASTSYALLSKQALILLKLSVVELSGMIFAVSGDSSHVQFMG